MKKTIEFENKIIVVKETQYEGYLEKEVCNTFEEAYKKMHRHYVGRKGHWWDEEDWNEEYDFEKVKNEFETYGYVEFCDSEEITTTEVLLKRELREID